jgi:hypothetical protein
MRHNKPHKNICKSKRRTDYYILPLCVAILQLSATRHNSQWRHFERRNKWMSVYWSVRHSFVPLNVPFKQTHYRRTYTVLMENQILYPLLQFVPCVYPAPITNWSDIWSGHMFFRIQQSVACINRYKFYELEIMTSSDIKYQIANICWLSQILQNSVTTEHIHFTNPGFTSLHITCSNLRIEKNIYTYRKAVKWIIYSFMYRFVHSFRAGAVNELLMMDRETVRNM